MNDYSAFIRCLEDIIPNDLTVEFGTMTGLAYQVVVRGRGTQMIYWVSTRRLYLANMRLREYAQEAWDRMYKNFQENPKIQPLRRCTCKALTLGNWPNVPRVVHDQTCPQFSNATTLPSEDWIGTDVLKS